MDRIMISLFLLSLLLFAGCAKNQEIRQPDSGIENQSGMTGAITDANSIDSDLSTEEIDAQLKGINDALSGWQ